VHCRLQLRQKLSQVQSKLLETQNVLVSREGELDLLQGDYDRLLRQQEQASESSLEREGRWKTRLAELADVTMVCIVISCDVAGCECRHSCIRLMFARTFLKHVFFFKQYRENRMFDAVLFLSLAQRVKSLQQELQTQRKHHAELQQKLTQQNESVSESVEKELTLLKNEHSKEVESLKSEIATKDSELTSLRNEMQTLHDSKKGE